MYFPQPEESDPGPFYIQEHGRLRSPRGVGPAARKRRRWSSGDSDQAIQQCPRHHVPCLRALCLDYVAANIHQVESLVGFPAIVGEDIFVAVCNQGRLKQYYSRRVAGVLKLFSDSYQQEVLSEMCLSQFPPPLLEECLPVLAVFQGLTKIDLSDQRLGDSHELLASLVNLPFLTHLVLVNNSFRDKAIQNMTAPMRMLQRGPLGLELLDLACNPDLTDLCVKYLCCFHQLHDLDISGSSITKSGICQIESHTALRLTDATGQEVDLRGAGIENKGWAAHVIDGWLADYTLQQTERDKRLGQSNPQAKDFYVSKKKRLLYARSVLKPRDENRPPAEPIIILRAGSVSTVTSPSDYLLTEGATTECINMTKKNQRKKRLAMTDIVNLCTESGGSESDSDNDATLGHQGPKSIHSGVVAKDTTNSVPDYGATLIHQDLKSLQRTVYSEQRTDTRPDCGAGLVHQDPKTILSPVVLDQRTKSKPDCGASLVHRGSKSVRSAVRSELKTKKGSDSGNRLVYHSPNSSPKHSAVHWEQRTKRGPHCSARLVHQSPESTHSPRQPELRTNNGPHCGARLVHQGPKSILGPRQSEQKTNKGSHIGNTLVHHSPNSNPIHSAAVQVENSSARPKKAPGDGATQSRQRQLHGSVTSTNTVKKKTEKEKSVPSKLWSAMNSFSW